MKKSRTTTLTALGLIAGATLGSSAQAADNPFAAQPLASGYQLAQADTKAPEAKCAADKKKEASCGADKKKEASCGADKKKEASCGADKKKAADGKCGEAKCAGKK